VRAVEKRPMKMYRVQLSSVQQKVKVKLKVRELPQAQAQCTLLADFAG
jgi:hypothetical protein